MYLGRNAMKNSMQGSISSPIHCVLDVKAGTNLFNIPEFILPWSSKVGEEIGQRSIWWQEKHVFFTAWNLLHLDQD